MQRRFEGFMVALNSGDVRYGRRSFSHRERAYDDFDFDLFEVRAYIT
jgi:hypothetical protein